MITDVHVRKLQFSFSWNYFSHNFNHCNHLIKSPQAVQTRKQEFSLHSILRINKQHCVSKVLHRIVRSVNNGIFHKNRLPCCCKHDATMESESSTNTLFLLTLAMERYNLPCSCYNRTFFQELRFLGFCSRISRRC